MKKSFLLVIFYFFTLVPDSLFSQDVTGKWSGIITMELWWEGITGPSLTNRTLTVGTYNDGSDPQDQIKKFL